MRKEIWRSDEVKRNLQCIFGQTAESEVSS